MAEAPPLLSIPQAPAPKGAVPEWVRGADGLALRAALFKPKGAPKGSVVLSPGRTEHLEKYLEVIGDLLARGFVVLAHDWRGQGLSGRMLKNRLKGHAKGWPAFLEDYHRLLDQFESRLPKPWIALGHSMGGCLTLLALVKGEERRFAACALSAPMLGIITDGKGGYGLARALTWISAHGGLSGRYLFGDPADPFKLTFERDRITHDRARWDRSRAQIEACPDLALGNLTWGWLEFALQAIGELRKPGVIEALDLPVLIVAAGDDDRVLTPATRALSRRLRHGRYVEVEAAYHEILMETDDVRAIFWSEFDALVGRAISPNA